MERTYGSGGTGKLKMRISEPVFFNLAISSAELANIIPLSDSMSSAERLKRVDSAVWRDLVGAIKTLRPETRDAFDRLLAARAEERRLFGDGDALQRLVEERDAIGVTLEVAGLDRPKILRTLRTNDLGSAASVLDLLDSEPLQEQDIIRHDQAIFEGLLDNASRVGQFEGGSTRVRVHVYDKKPLETVLGIDLLIYQSVYKSFLLIQYKTMHRTHENARPNWSYRIDQQILDQIAAMGKVEVAIEAQDSSQPEITDWRLNTTPFYFKFCETTRPDARDESLIRGITLSLEHLKEFLLVPESRGERGGQHIGYRNCARYLNNTQFIDLARDGWIGCDKQGFSLISKILQGNRAGGRLAMFAVIEKTTPPTAYDRGRRRT